MFRKAKMVLPLPDYKLQVHFADGSDKLYDMSALFEQYPVYKAFIEEPKLFEQAKVDVGGFGIVWDENIDIDSEEIYQNGIDVVSPFTGLLAISDAAAMRGLNESTLRKAISYGKLAPGVDVCNFGSQWVITQDALDREYPATKSS